MEKVNIKPDEVFDLKLSGKDIMICLDILTELPYRVAQPIISNIEQQVKQQKEIAEKK